MYYGDGENWDKGRGSVFTVFMGRTVLHVFSGQILMSRGAELPITLMI